MFITRCIAANLYARLMLVASVSFTATAFAASPPSISGSPPTSVVVGSAYSFVPTATDPDTPTRKLRFSISQRPAWAQFSSATGALKGTPGATGTWSGIVISVSDGHSSAALPAFSITAKNPNSAPTISGTPPNSALVGDPYAFTPSATDPDKDPLSFSAQNVPAWLTFNSSSGSLSGTPTTTDVGSYSNIQISVSDGSHTVALPTFSVSVNNNGSGTATLNWTPPTTNNDGSALTDLNGYRIYYGKSPDDLSTVIPLNDAGLSSYVIDGLGSGTYYFAITALAATGSESEKSQIVSKSFN
jgi:hypothetical protein